MLYLHNFDLRSCTCIKAVIMDQLDSSEDEIAEMVNYLDDLMNKNKMMLIHCVEGLGRSCLVAASYLKHKGLSSDEAIKTIRKAGGPRAVESKIQEDFLKNIDFN